MWHQSGARRLAFEISVNLGARSVRRPVEAARGWVDPVLAAAPEDTARKKRDNWRANRDSDAWPESLSASGPSARTAVRADGDLAHDLRSLTAGVVIPVLRLLPGQGLAPGATGMRHGARLDDETVGANAGRDERETELTAVHLHGRMQESPGGPKSPGTRGTTRGKGGVVRSGAEGRGRWGSAWTACAR